MAGRAWGNGNGGGIGGTGVYLKAVIEHCTIVDNTAWESGSGIYVNVGTSAGGGGDPNTRLTVRNCILWNKRLLAPFRNSYEEISISQGGETRKDNPHFAVSYSNIRGGWTGTGIIDDDPLFLGAANGNYQLASESICIDAGSPIAGISQDIAGNPRPSPAGGNPDMGAYEHQRGAGGGKIEAIEEFDFYISNTDRAMMGRIPAGSFSMGETQNDFFMDESALPVHTVQLDSFYGVNGDSSVNVFDLVMVQATLVRVM